MAVPELPYTVHGIDTFDESAGRDGWYLLAAFFREEDALAFAQKEAAEPHEGAGGLADQVAVLHSTRGLVFRKQRPG